MYTQPFYGDRSRFEARIFNGKDYNHQEACPVHTDPERKYNDTTCLCVVSGTFPAIPQSTEHSDTGTTE